MAALPASIIGHKEQTEQLLVDIESENVAHAYLFSGPAHIGKFSVAKWFAEKLLCTGLDEEECQETHEQMEKLIHPDYLAMDQLWMEDKQENWTVIAETSNVPQQHRAKKRARTDSISIDDVRALHERLIETGTSEYLCCLIRSIERMQDEATNAFLKILEEPPPRVVFLLTTQAQHSLRPTIVSRTRVLLFQPLSQKELRPLLQNVREEDQGFILHLSQGAPGRIVRLLDDPELLREEKQVHAAATRFWQTQSLHERLKWLSGYGERGADTDPLVLHLGLALKERIADEYRESWIKAYLKLLSGLSTNAHRALLLEEFALAVSAE